MLTRIVHIINTVLTVLFAMYQCITVRKFTYDMSAYEQGRSKRWGRGDSLHHEALLPPTPTFEICQDFELIVDYCSSIAQKQMKWCIIMGSATGRVGGHCPLIYKHNSIMRIVPP